MKKIIHSIWRTIKRIFIILFIAQLIYIIALKWINPPTTITMMANRISLLGNEEYFHKKWTSYENISSYAKVAVMAGEDQLFPENNGFDIKAIEKAWLHNQHSKRIRGASTISQQTAKNVFLWQGRDWFRKGLEVYFTFMIEKIWGKKRILEVYLNVAQMGPHIFGIGAAAEQYFHKNAQSLSAGQAAMIAACLPDPYRYKVQPPARITLARQQWILGQMNNLEGYPDIQELIRK